MPNAWDDINAFVASPPGGRLKPTPQAAAIRARGQIDVAEQQRAGRVQSEQVRQAGLNQRQANRQSAAAAYRGQIAQRRAQREQRQRVVAATKTGQTVLNANPFARLNERAANVPTPGGIGALVFILLALVFLIIPVNQGQTRFGLFWLTLLGRTKLDSGTGGVPPDTSMPNQGGTIAQATANAQASQTGQTGGGPAGLAALTGGNPTGDLNKNDLGLPKIALPKR